jgi:AGZA family xanthine/uracil permease-like MFS transporter
MSSEGGLAGYFRFAERGTDLVTEARAGVTTFMVMAYILFLNGNIIAGPLGLDPVAVSAGTRRASSATAWPTAGSR